MLGVASAVLTNIVAAPSNASVAQRIGYSLVALLAAVAVAVVIAFAWALLRAPYQQRDALTAVLTAAENEIARLNAPLPAPALRVANQLETDVTANCFRLRVWNDSPTAAQPSIELVQITDRANNHLVADAQMPIELAWTHHEWGRPTLSGQDVPGQTVAVLCLDQRANAAEAELYVYGRGYKPRIGRIHERLRGEYLYVTITARSPEHPNVPPVERRFVLRFSEEAPLRFIP